LAPPSSLLVMRRAYKGIESYYDSMAWSPDSRRILAASNSRIAIWDARTGKVQADYEYVPPSNSWRGVRVESSQDAKTLFRDGKAPAPYDAAIENSKGSGFYSWARFNDKLSFLAVMPSRGTSLQVIDTKTKQAVWQPRLKGPTSFEWYGDILCVKDNDDPWKDGDGPVKYPLLLWDAKTRKQLPSPPFFTGIELGGVSFKTDGRTVAYSQMKVTETKEKTEYQTEIIVWDYRANRVIWRRNPKIIVDLLQWSPDGKKLLAFNASDLPLRLLVLDQNGNRRFEREFANNLISWSPDSKRLAYRVWKPLNAGKVLTNRVEIHRFSD